MKNHLRLTYDRDGDGTGRLKAEVRVDAFTGTSSAWFGDAELGNFAKQLAGTYPLNPDAPLVLQGGYWEWDTVAPTLQEVHVGLLFSPVGVRGQVSCRVQLRTPPVHESSRPVPQASLQVELFTQYALIERFARQLARLAAGEVEVAELEGEG